MSTTPVVYVPFSDGAQASALAVVKEEKPDYDDDEAAVQENSRQGIEESDGQGAGGGTESATAGEMQEFSDEMIRVLLDLYKSHFSNMTNARNNNEKALWWEKLASDFNAAFKTSFSKKRLRTKVNNLKNKLRRFEEQHRKSGAGQNRVKMHRDLLDAFGNISGICVDKTRNNGRAVNSEGCKERLRDCDRLRPQHPKICVDFVTPPSQMGENSTVASSRANDDRRRPGEADADAEEMAKRRRGAGWEEDDARGQRTSGGAGEETRIDLKEGDQERRHRELMSVAQGILAALNKIVEKL